MASSPPSPPKTDIEPPVVSVFVRPLEVTVPVLDSPPLPKSQPPQKTVWSTMTSRIETETSVKRWATPQEKTEEGHPPGPEDQPVTKEGKKYEGNVKTITPSYKVGEPTHETKLGAFGTLPEGKGDYKMSMRQEDYKQTVIDPKVRSNANMPLHSTRLPDVKRTLADDFPSEHSKRSQIKLEPLEQRRFKYGMLVPPRPLSVERRPVTTSNYLTESVNRHRDADQSVLHRYLKAKEGDANKPWDKPNWPGAKKTNDDESLRELEHMKQKLETITRKAKASSMHNLSILSPDEFGRNIIVGQPSPTLHDIGTLIRMRKERYMDQTKNLRKYKSDDLLNKPPSTEDWSHSDPLHRQLRKEFHLSQYTERRASWSQEVQGPPRPEFRQQPVEEPRLVVPPAVVSVKVEDERPRPSKGPEEDYPERLMSPPPQAPRSILKSERQQQRYAYQYSSEQHVQRQQYEEYREVRENGDPGRHNHHHRPPPERVQPPPPPPPLPQPQQQHTVKPTTAPPPPPPQPMRPKSTTFHDLPEEERYRIMQENLMRHRQHRPTTPKQPTTSFNGPFFKLEEVTPSGQPAPRTNGNGYTLSEMKTMSMSEMELDRHFPHSEEPQVVVWPPPSDKNRPRSQSVMSKSMKDPERIEELRRQQAMEREAMQRHEEQKMRSMVKQVRAMQIQQERLYEQQHGVTSPVPMIGDEFQPYSTDAEEEPVHNGQQQPMRIFETRPISSMSEAMELPTWKRTYVVERPHDVAKNEIIASDQLLERDQYEVDILKRREAFVEKPEPEPEIQRTGKRWQPPPDKPYVWPTLRRPVSVEPHMTSPIDFAPGPPMDDEEYKWAPVLNDPAYRRERKNFTPTHSPPPSPRRGIATLDEVNKRQTKYVIQPTTDGSHRPKPAFRKERHTPSGGFYPHAPNAIKVVKRRAASVQNLNSPNIEHEDVEVIQQRNYHRVDPTFQPPSRSASAADHRLRRDSSHHSSHHELSAINDWEKIYELPPHSSTIVGKDVPRNVDVRRRLNQFEGSIQNLAERKNIIVRAPSVDSSSNSQPFPPPDYDLAPPPPREQPRQVSRRNSVASTQHQGRERRHSRSHSRAPSSILLSPTPRGDTPAAQRARAHIARSTAASPTPPSYDRARAYVPPALPGGYRLGDPLPDPRVTSPQPGHAKRMARSVADASRRSQPHPTPQTSRAPSRATSAAAQPPKTDDLDRLNRRTAELEERSRARRTDYRLIDSEILKTTPAPLPKVRAAESEDKKRFQETHETLESRTSEAHREDHDRSGYATDVSTATWQFSTHSFSPRSVVSMNGAREDILKSRVPADLESVASSARTAPAYGIRVVTSSASSALDDKPRSIMKRRELESREQMMYPSNQQLVEHKTYQRSQSNVAKPTVTETVQRFEETRRTEEIERRVQRKERRERRSRHHSSSRHNSGAQWGSENYLTDQRRVASLPRRQIVYQQANRAMTNDEIDDVVRDAYEAAEDARRHGTRVRSNSLSRGLPSSQEAYYRQTTTRRERDQSGSRYEDEAFGGRGLAHARYGSLSDSLRRGELKYIPNGEVRENYQMGNGRNMHKSYSTRDVFSGGDHFDRRSLSSQRRGSQQQVSPFVEFPPTLPRRSERDNYRPISKSRSYADWDDAGRAGFGRQVQRYDDDMSRLEAEFRDSLLMPMPRGNMNERDHRTEQIPGGYETFDKNKRANSGRRLGRDGQPVDFHESSQEYNFKREQELDRRR